MTTYATVNFPTKKALRDAIRSGQSVSVQQAGLGPDITDGRAYLSGPWYPVPHRWYAVVDVKNGAIVRVIS